jgi:hypothetical protein
VLDADTGKGLSEGRWHWGHVYSRRETFKVDNLLHQTEGGGNHGLRGDKLTASKVTRVWFDSENGLTVARIPKT